MDNKDSGSPLQCADMDKQSIISRTNGSGGRLLNRLKNMLAPAKDDFDPTSGTLQRAHSVSSNQPKSTHILRRQQTNTKHTQHSPHMPRLVARSAIREDFISPDLRALADIDCPQPPPLSVRTNCSSERSWVSPFATNATTFPYSYSRSDRPAHVNISSSSSSVFTPRYGNAGYRRFPSSQPISPEMNNNVLLLTPHTNGSTTCTLNTLHSADADHTIAPDSPCLPTSPLATSYLLGRDNSTTTDHRASQNSDATAALASELTNTLKANSPNQCLPSPPLTNTKTSRRPYSAGYIDHAQLCDTKNSAGAYFTFQHPLQRGSPVYMRTSYVDSDLVKSTFDLAKLLPYAPR